jgi:hypothetical protein
VAHEPLSDRQRRHTRCASEPHRDRAGVVAPLRVGGALDGDSAERDGREIAGVLGSLAGPGQELGQIVLDH